MANTQEFGSYEVHYSIDPNTGLYHVSSGDLNDAEIIGVNSVFRADRFDVMVNRCTAHGFKLVQEQIGMFNPPTQASDTRGM